MLCFPAEAFRATSNNWFRFSWVVLLQVFPLSKSEVGQLGVVVRNINSYPVASSQQPTAVLSSLPQNKPFPHRRIGRIVDLGQGQVHITQSQRGSSLWSTTFHYTEEHRGKVSSQQNVVIFHCKPPLIT